MTYETTGTAFTVNTTTAGTQRYGDIAALQGGGTIAVWEETDSSGAGVLVRAQRLTETGAKAGPEIAVTALADTGNKGAPTVTGLEDGGFVVVWYDAAHGVLAQRFDAAGQEVGAELTLDGNAANFLAMPSVSAMLGGGYAVSWQRGSGQSSDVFSQIVDADSAKVGGIVALTASNDGRGQFYGATAGLATGGSVTVWKDDDGTIKAQRLGSTGIRIDGVFTVGSGIGDGGGEPGVVALADGGYAVVWASYANGLSEIHARLFADSGTPRGAAFTVASGTESFVSSADVAAAPDGGFTISWKGFAYSGANGADVFARSYAADGTPDGAVFTLNTARAGQQSDGAVTIDGDGRLVGLWTDGSGNALDIKGQVFEPVATPPGAPSAASRFAPQGDAGNATLVDGAFSKVATAGLDGGGYVMLWTQDVGDVQTLFGQRYDGDGRAVGARIAIYSADIGNGLSFDENSHFRVTGRDGGGFAVVWQAKEPGSTGVFASRSVTQVFDDEGSPVAAPVVSSTGAGQYHSPQDAETLSNGTYVVLTRSALENSSVEAISFQRHTASGTKLGDVVSVAASAESGNLLTDATATALENGGFVVAWSDGGIVTTKKLAARIYDDNGNARTAAFDLTPDRPGVTSAPTVAALENGNFLVAWSYKPANGDPETFAQVYSAGGAKVGSEIAFATGEASNLSLVELKDGRFLLAWTEKLGTQFHGQLFDAGGARVGGPALLFENDAISGHIQYPPAYAVRDDGAVVVNWGDAAPTSIFDAEGALEPRSSGQFYNSDGIIQTRVLTLQNPVTGNGGANGLDGTAGDDRILGLAGTDTLKGLAGDDVLIGGADGDRLEGGAGTDAASYATAAEGVGIFLTHVADNTGEARGDTYALIERFVGSDHLDFMEGDARGNHFDGGLGNDTLFGLGGADTLIGGYGDDILEGGTGVDRLDGGAGLDAASYAKAKAGVVASLRDRSLNTGEATGDNYAKIELLVGSAFDDTLRGDIRSNRLDGNDGKDTLFGDDGVDFLFGNAADDMLDGGQGADRLEGGAGNDSYSVDDAGDRVVEAVGGGINDAVTTSVSYALLAAAEIEFLRTTNVNAITAIKLTGSGTINSIYGDAGANTLDGKGGADRLYGLNGNDTYLVDNANDAVNEFAAGGTRDIVKASTSYVLKARQYVEELETTNDAGKTAIDLTGNEFANTITGNNGSNNIDGGLGNDILTGDGVTKGTGRDVFVFDDKLGSKNVDRIMDFNPIHDEIELENSGSGLFTKLARGDLREKNFKDLGIAGAKADGDDYILYNRKTGILSYDADGVGGAKAIQFATVNGSPDGLTYKDFFVV